MIGSPKSSLNDSLRKVYMFAKMDEVAADYTDMANDQNDLLRHYDTYPMQIE